MNNYRVVTKENGEFLHVIKTNSEVSSCPRLVYKYRECNNANHQMVLNDSCLFFAPPTLFEDSKDCRLKLSVPNLEKLKMIYYIHALEDGSLNTERKRKKFVSKWCKQSPLLNVKTLKMKEQQMCEFFNQKTGVLSLTGICDNPAMWGKYAKAGTGFCVGFNTKMLQDTFQGASGNVKYTNTLPDISCFDDTITAYLKIVAFKEEKWEFEHEYRFVKTNFDGCTADDRNLKFPVAAIEEVVLGKYMSDADKRDIIKIVKDKYPHAEIKVDESYIRE